MKEWQNTSECKYRAKDGECLLEKMFPYKEYCVDGPCPHYEPTTNYDRIHAESDHAKLAEILLYIMCDKCGIHGLCKLYGPKESFESKCKSDIVDWLKQEAT